MPTPVGHTLGALAAMIAIEPSIISSRCKPIVILGTAFIVGTLADADFLVAHYTTAPYLRHHYFSHSIPFAILFTVLCWIILKIAKFHDPKKGAALLGTAYGSHLFLDYFAHDGSKPYGIPLLWPFSDRHFIAPVDVFFSIHRGEFSDLFSWHNFFAVLIEIAVLAPIVVLMFLIANSRLKAAGLSKM
jgi:membrane-bound metal-dependent hydrolase YbcI (DUF457 family)